MFLAAGHKVSMTPSISNLRKAKSCGIYASVCVVLLVEGSFTNGLTSPSIWRRMHHDTSHACAGHIGQGNLYGKRAPSSFSVPTFQMSSSELWKLRSLASHSQSVANSDRSKNVT
jgi:hypothetical protein